MINWRELHAGNYGEPDRTKAGHSPGILEDLPEWFGIPEAREEYIRESGQMPFFAAVEGEDVLGFMSLKTNNAFTCEIFITGVKKRAHRCGAGRALFAAFEAYARERGFRLVQVKTVAPGHYAEYDATVAFYRKVGFLPLEVFPTLWDESNPCLILVKPL